MHIKLSQVYFYRCGVTQIFTISMAHILYRLLGIFSSLFYLRSMNHINQEVFKLLGSHKRQVAPQNI